jgi:hypothetical protein
MGCAPPLLYYLPKSTKELWMCFFPKIQGRHRLTASVFAKSATMRIMEEELWYQENKGTDLDGKGGGDAKYNSGSCMSSLWEWVYKPFPCFNSAFLLRYTWHSTSLPKLGRVQLMCSFFPKLSHSTPMCARLLFNKTHNEQRIGVCLLERGKQKEYHPQQHHVIPKLLVGQCMSVSSCAKSPRNTL